MNTMLNLKNKCIYVSVVDAMIAKTNGEGGYCSITMIIAVLSNQLD